jgi:hypothetical protein
MRSVETQMLLAATPPVAFSRPHPRRRHALDQLREGAVDGRTNVGALVEVDGEKGAFADTFGRELEFLPSR